MLLGRRLSPSARTAASAVRGRRAEGTSDQNGARHRPELSCERQSCWRLWRHRAAFVRSRCGLVDHEPSLELHHIYASAITLGCMQRTTCGRVILSVGGSAPSATRGGWTRGRTGRRGNIRRSEVRQSRELAGGRAGDTSALADGAAVNHRPRRHGSPLREAMFRRVCDLAETVEPNPLRS